jgi:hypothetical protein
VFNDFVQANFDQATQKQIANLRQNEISGKDDVSAGGLNARALTSELGNRLLSIGIDPKPKPNDMEAREQIGTIQKYVTDGVFAQQQQLGRKMSAQEITDFVDNQFAKNSTFKGILWDTTKPTISLTPSDIPSSDLAAVKAALAKNGNSHPSSDQIMRTYWAGKNTNGGQ